MESAAEKRDNGPLVLTTPAWVRVVRTFQFLTSCAVLGLSARLIHDAFLDEIGLAVATAILTWLFLVYAFLPQSVVPSRSAYNVVILIVCEAILVVLWLATFAAVAARRASFKYDFEVDGCFDDGGAINSKYCYRKRDSDVILFSRGLAMMSAIAGLGALLWLLFIATLAWTLLMLVRWRKSRQAGQGSAPPAVGASYQMEPKPGHAAVATQQQQQYQQPPQQQYQQPPQQQYQQYQQPQEQQYQQYQQQPVQPQATGGYQPAPLSPHGQHSYPQQNSPYQTPQNQQVYQDQYPQSHQKTAYEQSVHPGTELSSGTPPPRQQYATPSPVTSSPPPRQTQPHHQAYNQQAPPVPSQLG